MKVLTVRQPWAGLIACGLKDVENRSWTPCLSDGERFAIHAGRFDGPDNLSDHPLCHHHGVVLCDGEARLRSPVTPTASGRCPACGIGAWRACDLFAACLK